MVSLAFLFTAFVIVATPGTGAIYSIIAGLSRGKAAGILAAFACTLGIVPHLLAAITGLAAIMHTSTLAFNLLKYLGVAYLLYMAWGMWRDQSLFAIEDPEIPQQNAWQVIRTGIVINLLNPKLTVFFFAFLPQFIPANSSQKLPQMLLLSGLFMLMTFTVFVIYALFSASMRNFILKKPKILNTIRKSFALTFVALSAKLAMTSR